jgi:hypothetical protein
VAEPERIHRHHARLTLAQLSVPEKTNEITAIPDLLDQLAETKQLEGALVTIDEGGWRPQALAFRPFGRVGAEMIVHPAARRRRLWPWAANTNSPSMARF